MTIENGNHKWKIKTTIQIKCDSRTNETNVRGHFSVFFLILAAPVIAFVIRLSCCKHRTLTASCVFSLFSIAKITTCSVCSIQRDDGYVRLRMLNVLICDAVAEHILMHAMETKKNSKQK